MWKLLDFAAPQRSSASERGVFQASFQDAIRPKPRSQEQEILENPELNSPVGNIHDSTGEYAAPPDWFSPIPNTSPQMIREMAGTSTVEMQQEDILGSAQPQMDFTQNLADPSSWTWASGAASVPYGPWTQHYDRTGANSGWWDFGNL
jgi:hypothetical protein